jgi:hypothetical protein
VNPAALSGGPKNVKKVPSLIVAALFATAGVGIAAAQTPAAPPARTEEKKDAKPADKPAPAKKPAAKSASGSVKSASADSVVVAGKDKGKDAEWTFAVDAKTKITKAGKAVPAADLKAGDAVQVRYTEDGGKPTAQAVTVRPATPPAAARKTDAKPAEKPAEKR